jgi:hypothetical protein
VIADSEVDFENRGSSRVDEHHKPEPPERNRTEDRSTLLSDQLEADPEQSSPGSWRGPLVIPPPRVLEYPSG